MRTLPIRDQRDIDLVCRASVISGGDLRPVFAECPGLEFIDHPARLDYEFSFTFEGYPFFTSLEGMEWPDEPLLLTQLYTSWTPEDPEEIPSKLTALYKLYDWLRFNTPYAWGILADQYPDVLSRFSPTIDDPKCWAEHESHSFVYDEPNKPVAA